MTESESNLVADIKDLKDGVRQLEEALEALHDLITYNHAETLEKIVNLAEGGQGFSTYDS